VRVPGSFLKQIFSGRSTKCTYHWSDDRRCISYPDAPDDIQVVDMGVQRLVDLPSRRTKMIFQKKKVLWENVLVANLLGLTYRVTYNCPVVKDDAGFEQVETDRRQITWITDIDEEQMRGDFLKKFATDYKTHRLPSVNCRID
jgi:hypothetical protein